jgi:hypothetical protein
MTTRDRAARIQALAERSSYVENVLRHSLVAALAGEQWVRDPMTGLQILNSEVDDSGFDIVLALGGRARYIQLKQTHAEKSPPSVSVRLSFAGMQGSCVVLVAHNLRDLSLAHLRFFGSDPGSPMPDIANGKTSIAPGRRNAAGQRKRREGYRNIRLSRFSAALDPAALLDRLFPMDGA